MTMDKLQIRYLLKEIEKELDYVPFQEIMEIIQVEKYMEYKIEHSLDEYKEE